jgi:hypothetical protein
MTMQLTLTEAARRTRQPRETVEAALADGDLRSLAPHDLDAWRRGLVATRVRGNQ